MAASSGDIALGGSTLSDAWQWKGNTARCHPRIRLKCSVYHCPQGWLVIDRMTIAMESSLHRLKDHLMDDCVPIDVCRWKHIFHHLIETRCLLLNDFFNRPIDLGFSKLLTGYYPDVLFARIESRTEPVP
jgi:hypothetical protein